MIPKLIINKHIKPTEQTKEEILQEKVDELLKKNEEIKQELEELKNMI